jgi:D-alanine-D-alanine ligase-like ATP-grasp enzyme
VDVADLHRLAAALGASVRVVPLRQVAERREQLLRSARKRASKVLRPKAAEIRKLVSTGRGRSARS